MRTNAYESAVIDHWRYAHQFKIQWGHEWEFVLSGFKKMVCYGKVLQINIKSKSQVYLLTVTSNIDQK